MDQTTERKKGKQNKKNRVLYVDEPETIKKGGKKGQSRKKWTIIMIAISLIILIMIWYDVVEYVHTNEMYKERNRGPKEIKKGVIIIGEEDEEEEKAAIIPDTLLKEMELKHHAQETTKTTTKTIKNKNNKKKKKNIEKVEELDKLEELIEEISGKYPVLHADEKKQTAVRNAFLHAWKGYKQNAWGHDDLRPLSVGKYHDWVQNGIGMTIIDALDTAHIMGLKKQVDEGVQWIRNHLNFNRNSMISTFETTIRVLGGLISAYDLIGNEILKEKARDIGERLYKAFKPATGIPHGQVNLATGHSVNVGWARGGVVNSEYGTLQIEFRRLSAITGDPKFEIAATKINKNLEKNQPADGLFPTMYDNNNDKWINSHISFGAWGDSTYEYLIKQYVMTGENENYLLDMYKKTLNGFYNHLVARSSPSKLMYVKERNSPSSDNKMDHLVCFVGGMLALGSDYSGNKERDLNAAKEITKTCYETYKRQPSGLGPETVTFGGANDFYPGVRTYLLRPETVESIFYMYRYTGDEIYRQWGWDIFQAIEKHTKTSIGYSSVSDVTKATPPKVNEMHSFFLAETLKYLYLLFSDSNTIRLDEYVFNTEAHPVKIYHLKK